VKKPKALRSMLDLGAGSNGAVALLVRNAVVGLACLALAGVGGLSQGLAPWGALSLCAGVGLAASLRWGLPVLAGAASGLLVALLALGEPVMGAVCAAVVLWPSCALAHAALTRAGFDARLDRAWDVGALTVAVAVAAALPAALLMAVWVTATSQRTPLAAVALGWAVLCLGMLLSALPVLALERRALQAMQPDSPWLEPALGAAAAAVMLWSLWMAAGSHAALAPVAAYLPHLLVVALALRRRLALASSALLLATLLVAGVADQGLLLWGPGGAVKAPLAAWAGSALALLLAVHAAVVDTRGRSQRWEWALDGSHLGVADWSLTDPRGFASTAWRTLTGHPEKAWTAEAWLRQVHPEDRDRVEAGIATVSGGEAGRQQLELRMPADPGWRWLEATLLVTERDSQGRPTRLLATLADISERREALERQRMSASLFQHLHEGLLITDAELRVLDVNQAYSHILGVRRDEVMGTVPSLLRPNPADPIARQQRAAMWAGVAESGHWRGELFERRRSGELCTLQATISTVLGPAGDLRYHVLVLSDITEQRVQREQLERQAHFDELTRLPNRTRLSQLLDDAMLAADRDGYLLVVCYLDLDRFKPVNDRFGHAAGDRLLAELAGRLRSALRSREHWEDSAARLGGDEFVLLLRAGTLDEARMAVERVLRVVSLPYLIDPAQDPVQVTASMGATVYPIDRSDADTLLRHADHAMYGAKQAGRNGYLFFDTEHRRRAEERVMAIGRVQEALDLQEFVLHYQPKVDMRSGRVLGFEALLRWEHPQQGLIAPMQFLPLIENTGLSSRVGDWVLSQALDHLALWRRDGLDISVSVNISARHLQEPDFALRLSELLARHPDPIAKHLELEMLETAAHADIEATSALVGRCQALGVRFALDDFGTGYSTLTYLKRLPVDVLKIDRSFVHHMLDDTQDRAIVEGVIGLARTFGCVVVAEGVESPAQARTLLELGCEIGQGTGVAAPMPSDQVAPWVREYRGMFALAPAEVATLLPAAPARGR
jgi:diguanylate cyclase (GGDEF)-like protein/PAS domain S-box-containing protein